MEDELLDNIKWDEGRYEVSGVLTLPGGKTVRFTVDGYDESFNEAARDAIKLVIANEPLMRHKVAVSMLELYPEWNDGDIITAEELAQKFTLVDVTFMTEGGGQLCYAADDDIFTDHWICTFFDANGEIDEPSLEG